MTSSMPWKRAPKLRHRPTLFVLAVTCNFLSIYNLGDEVNTCRSLG